jgi:hypothetical protein
MGKKQASVEMVSFVLLIRCFQSRVFHTLRLQIASCFDIGLLVNPMGLP